jgi:hypothetical protein
MSEGAGDPGAEGIGELDLLCPQEDVVARLIKQATHQPIQLSLPGRARQNWPRDDEGPDFIEDCPTCHRPVQGHTAAIQANMDELVNDRNEHRGGLVLSWQVGD